MGNVFRSVFLPSLRSSSSPPLILSSSPPLSPPAQCPDLFHRTPSFSRCCPSKHFTDQRPHHPFLISQLLRETIEAAIIISVLLGLVESLFDDKKNEVEGEGLKIEPEEKKRLIRKMRLMVWGGALTGAFRPFPSRGAQADQRT